MALLSYMLAMRCDHRTGGDADALLKYDQTLAEIMQDVGAALENHPPIQPRLNGFRQDFGS